MSFVRTVLGDIDAADLGVTDSHDHIIIAGGKPVQMSADFLLADVDKAVAELVDARAMGLRSVVDAMPIGCGRNPGMLAAVSRRSGIHIVAPTGLHHARFYDQGEWTEKASAAQLAQLFTADVTEGIDANDHSGPDVERTEHRAGVIKIGGSGEFPTTRDARVFEAAAMSAVITGAPILTHCEGGEFALEQVDLIVTRGATARGYGQTQSEQQKQQHRLASAGGRRFCGQSFCGIGF